MPVGSVQGWTFLVVPKIFPRAGAGDRGRSGHAKTAAPSKATVMSEAPWQAPWGPRGWTKRSLVTDTPGCSIWPLPSFNPENSGFLPGTWDSIQGRQRPRAWLTLAQQRQRATVDLAELFKGRSKGPGQDHHTGWLEPWVW